MKLLKSWMFHLAMASFSILASTNINAQQNPMYMQQDNFSSIRWLNNYEQAVSQSKATSRPILILFTGTTWCPACVRLERQVLNQPEFAKALVARFIFLKAEFPDYSQGGVDASPFKNLLNRYNINAFPTMIVVNANGQKLYSVPYQEGGLPAYIQQLSR